MIKTEKKECAEDVAQKFMCLDDADKQFIVGYTTGIQAEQQRWEK